VTFDLDLFACACVTTIALMGMGLKVNVLVGPPGSVLAPPLCERGMVGHGADHRKNFVGHKLICTNVNSFHIKP